jgi:aryl-alcohol dehydrogenase-like predicted oxidoreductase
MRYRRMGHSDLRISEIGFGCGGNAGLMIRGSFAQQQRIVARALELGINYFDTAPDYGDGVAEENLGRVLKALKARPVIASKVEVRQGDRGAIADHVVRSTEDSLKRLGVDCLDVLQIHNGPTFEKVPMAGQYYAQLPLDDFLRPGGAIEGLQRIVRDGKARHVGFICRGNDGLAVRRLLDTGIFRMINLAYNLLNPTAGAAPPPGLALSRDFDRVLDAARDSGVGTAIYSALAGGFLTDDSVTGESRHPLARAVDPAAETARRGREQAAQLLFLARDSGISLAQAAYRFVLAHSGVTTVLGGFSSIDQLEELVAVSGAGPFPPDQLARLGQVWGRNFTAPARGQP